jgi:hypothetical protein
VRFRNPYLFGLLLILISFPSCRPMKFGSVGSWNFWTGEFRWTRGTVRLPPGWTYQERNEGDSFSGAFVSPDRKQWLGFDMGSYAGFWATPSDCLFEERIVRGARVWTARSCPDPRRLSRYAVTFPDSGIANFFIYTNNIADAEPIWFIARSFRPEGPVTRIEWPPPR